MTVWRLVVREILYRRFSFGLGALSVIVAVGCVVGQLTLLRTHDVQTERIIALKEAQTRKDMQRLEDDYRKITKGMGFNLLILPKQQDLGDFYADDYAQHDMPEAHAAKLAQSGLMSIRHLLPSIQQKLKWPEQRRTIILIGVRGEVPIAHLDPKQPLLQAVRPGTVVLGYELHRNLDLGIGQKLTLLGREFLVAKCHPERGTKDDITIWMDLAEAQSVLGKPGRINAILALKCHCAGIDLARIRAEVAAILPDTRVIEFASKALARAEARNRAAVAARRAIDAEVSNRARLRREREAFAAVLVPLVLVGCIVWIGCLTLANVRERRAEIGILRALGVGSWRILAAFLGKAAVTGLIGAGVGYALGVTVGMAPCQDSLAPAQPYLGSGLFLAVFVSAPLLSCLAALVPALAAVQQDPAIALQEQ